MNKWDKIFLEGTNFTPLNEIFLKNLLNKLKTKSAKESKTLIDLGCGVGDAIIKFSKSGLSVIGIDSSEVALKMAKDNLEENHIENFELKNIDLNNLTITGKYDLVLCKLTYAFIENKEEFLNKIKDIMNNDSIFILITPVLHKNVEYLPKDKPGIAVDLEDTNKLLAKLFISVEIFNHNYLQEKIDEVTYLLMK